MPPSKPNPPLIYYPAYTYPASPTYFIWVKLACHDVHHHLTTQPDRKHHQSSTGNPLYFYLNHPIQFVQVTGIVVAIEDFHPHIFLFTLDDSSGSTIDVVWRKPKPLQNDTTAPAATATATAKVTQPKDKGSDQNEPSLLPLLTTLSISSTILAKGTLSPFRGTLQLNLLRLTPLTPVQEVRLISSRTAFLLSTLLKPWSLSQSSQQRLLKKATGERDEETERALRARKRRQLNEERERRHAKRILSQWEDEEKQRVEEAEKARLDGLEVMKKMQNREGRRQ